MGQPSDCRINGGEFLTGQVLTQERGGVLRWNA